MAGLGIGSPLSVAIRFLPSGRPEANTVAFYPRPFRSRSMQASDQAGFADCVSAPNSSTLQPRIKIEPPIGTMAQWMIWFAKTML